MPEPARNQPAYPTGRRQGGRLRLHLVARIVTLSGTRAASLLDLSRNGAKLAVPEPMFARADVVVEWNRFEAFGRVVWYRSGLCGVVFDEPLPDAVLLATRDLVAAPDATEAARRAAASFVSGQTARGFAAG